MVIKPKTKTTTVRKVTNSKPVVKKPVSENFNLQAIVDLHSKELKKLDQMYISLQNELMEIQKQISGLKINIVETKKPVIKPKKTATSSVKVPERKNSKITSKVSSKSASVKSVTKIPAKGKKEIKSHSDSLFIDDIIVIPKEIPERINSLTSKKKVTQNQIAKELDISQKEIHEIATRKVKDINKDKLLKITAVLKKYETK